MSCFCRRRALHFRFQSQSLLWCRPTGPLRAATHNCELFVFKRDEYCLGCKAYQSSTYNSRDAAYAVNGDTSGNGVNEISMTQQDSQAWLEIDLGKMAIIEEIRLWNRTDVPKDRHVAKDTYTQKLFPCWCLVGRDPFDVQLNQVGFKNNLRDSVCKIKFSDNKRMSSWHTPANTQGRYVRVQLESFEQLGIAEIEVFGNFGLSKGVGRVSYAQAGRDVTVAVIRPSRTQLILNWPIKGCVL